MLSYPSALQGFSDAATRAVQDALGRAGAAAVSSPYLGSKYSVPCATNSSATAAVHVARVVGAGAMPGSVRPEQAVPTIQRPLPPIPPEASRPDPDGKQPITLLLFYQYVEPMWTEKESSAALKHVLALGKEHAICGRGRLAREGLNCTLSGSAADIRAFCQALRDWKPDLFGETDFKLTDGLPNTKRFKALTVRKTEELVAYGLAGERAPTLQGSSAKHVDAIEYHELLKQPDTVVIDVRNAYESAIGHFQPPAGGATLLDPKMRNSREFPKWISDESTKAALKGKKVLMYCTGGIRCERATALLDQMQKAEPSFNVEDITMVRGGVERYMRTFPEGGFWKGKNYLFDRRFEQVPEAKASDALAADVESCCCVCSRPWAEYRGQHKCAGSLPPPTRVCAVPVLVCTGCQPAAAADPPSLRCPLCQEGYVAPQARPALGGRREEAAPLPVDPRPAKRARPLAPPSSRLFVGGLPYLTNATAVRSALAAAAASGGADGGDHPLVAVDAPVDWLRDQSSGLFYGSARVQMGSVEAAEAAVRVAGASGLRMGKRKLRLNFAPVKEGEEWPSVGFEQKERPPVG